MSETVISFYDCCPADTGTRFTVSGSAEGGAFRVNEARLRQTAGLILTVGRRVCRALTRMVLPVCRRLSRIFTAAGRRLLYRLQVFRI